MNNYEMAWRDSTTGWDSKTNDVNGKNFYGMTPAQVAVQAGNVEEFEAITTAPDFDPEKVGGLLMFLDICKRDNTDAYTRMLRYYKEVFLASFYFDAATRKFMRKH